MGRTLSEVIDALPKARRRRVGARYQQLNNDVESLRELRQAAGLAQEEIAAALNIKQPSVSKIEKQTDMYISTLRSYVEALGGELELTVRLPSRPPVRLDHLGEALDSAHPSRRSRAKSARKPARA